MKTILSIIALLISFTSASYSQQPDWIWANSGGGSSVDYATGISVDANQNVFVTGWFNSDSIIFGNTILINIGKKGSSDIFIAKYNSSGELVWAKSFGGSGDDKSNSIKANKKGDIVITGSFNSNVIKFYNTVLSNTGDNDVFIANFTEAGNLLWATSAGGSANDEGNSISCDDKNNTYLTGIFESASLSFGNKTLTNNGKHDIFIACYTSSGKLIWAKNMGGDDDDLGSTITTTPKGDSYLSGKFNSAKVDLGGITVKNVDINGSPCKIFLAKYNAAGNLMWGKSIGGSYYDEANSITSDKWGNVYLTGWFKSDTIILGCDTLMECTILTQQRGVDYGDIFIAKYSSGGEPVWAQRAGGMAKDYGFGIATDAIGDVYLSGVFESNFISFGGMQLTNASGNDIFISKYNATGQVVWAKSIYGSAQSRAITTDSNGDIYLTGIFNSTQMTLGSGRLINQGSGDFFVGKLK